MGSALPERENGLILTADAIALGLGAASRRARAEGAIVRVRRGVYVADETDRASNDTQRYLSRIHAVAATVRGAVLTGPSAAAVLGLPRLGPWPEEVHLLSPNGTSRRRNGIVEVVSRGDEAVLVRAGFRMTEPALTLLHIARREPYFDALLTIEAALFRPRSGGKPLCEPGELERMHRSRLPYRGSSRAQRVLRTASVLSESPLETLSRLTIAEGGFPEPVQQFAVPTAGRSYEVDFAWPEYGIVAEADGFAKYAEAPARRVMEEKRREDAIRRRVRHFLRWGWSEAWERTPVHAALLAAGLPRQERTHRLR